MIMQQYSEPSYVQHCNGSNISDLSMKKMKLKEHTSKKNSNNYYYVDKLVVTYLNVIFIVPKLWLEVVMLR